MIRQIGVPSSLSKKQAKVFRDIAATWAEAGVSKSEIAAVFGSEITQNRKRRKRGAAAKAVRAEIVRQIKAGQIPRAMVSVSSRGARHSVYFLAEQQKKNPEVVYWKGLFLALFKNKNPLYPPGLIKYLDYPDFWDSDFRAKIVSLCEALWKQGVKNRKTSSFFETADNILSKYKDEKVNRFLNQRRTVAIRAVLLREVSARALFFQQQEEKRNEARKNGSRSKKKKK